VSRPNRRRLVGLGCDEQWNAGPTVGEMCTTHLVSRYLKHLPYPSNALGSTASHYWIRRTDGKLTPTGHTNAMMGVNQFDTRLSHS
jgi:hypothetical protein